MIIHQIPVVVCGYWLVARAVGGVIAVCAHPSLQ